MNEQKKPQAGEWWIKNDNSERVYIVGNDSSGDVVYESQGEEKDGDDWSGWHHEPRCTGWDWQPEPEPEWFDLTPHDGHVLRKDVDEINHGAVYVEVNASEGVSIGAVKATYGGKKFRCLLKDAPPELLKPVESPDDWVTQDRVPARLGIDKYQWVRKGLFPDPDNWSSVKRETTLKHGDGDYSATVFHVRCRRRDLPPIPEPKPATQREVLLYWYDGNVVGRYADCPPTDQSFVPLTLRDGKVFIETETLEVVR